MRNQVLDKTLPIRIDEKGSSFLGLPTGITGRSFSITKLVSSNKLYGWIVKNGIITEWKPAGMIQKDSDTFVYGNLIDGVSLEAIFDESVEKQLRSFKELASAFKTLTDNKIEVSFLATNAILFLKEGGVAILPPDLMRELLNFYGQEEKCLASIACNHPDMKSGKKISYFLGSIAYRIVTGVFPFTGNVEEDVRYEIRNRDPLSPDFRHPGLLPEVVSVIMKAIGRTNPGAPALDQWVIASEAFLRDGIENQVQPEIAIKVIREGKIKEEKRIRSVRRKMFLEKYRGLILGITIPVLVVGAIVGFSVNSIVNRERVTKGFPPRKVVETYYNSINSLDVTTIGDCVTGNAGSADLNTVMNLYVMTKQGKAYDNSLQYVTAEEWDKKGRPLIEPEANMYGITRVTINQVKEEPEPVFSVTYERWYTEKDPVASQWELKHLVTGISVEDRVYLMQKKSDWVIYRLDRIKEEPIAQK